MPYRTVAVISILLAGFMFLMPASLRAGANEEAKIISAVAVMKELTAIPENAIPPSLLDGAYGIAIFPDLLKAGFIGGVRYGSGIVMVHAPNRGWSDPVFFKLAGGSFGLQIGAQSSDVILVFNSARSLDYISSGKFTLGVDASVAAGPVGRLAEAGTDLQMRAEILSYSKSRGLFAGVALEGAALYVDYDATAAFYNKPGILPADVFKGAAPPAPPATEELKSILQHYSGH